MCLDILLNNIKENEGEGWKAYIEDIDGTLYAPYTGDIVLVGEPMLSEEKSLCNNGWPLTLSLTPDYLKGFHVFTSKKDAEWYAKDFEIQRGSVFSTHPNWKPRMAIRKVLWKDKIVDGKSHLIIWERKPRVDFDNIYYHYGDLNEKYAEVVVANQITVLSNQRSKKEGKINVKSSGRPCFQSC